MEKLALVVVMEARKLRPYFQSHTIVMMTTHPLKTFLHSPNHSRRLEKWAVDLSEYEIEYQTRTSVKSQVLADFLVELPKKDPEVTTSDRTWSLKVDGASSKQGAGVEIHLTFPHGEIIELSFRLDFIVSNNEAEYKALVARLHLAKAACARRVRTFCDSKLVVSQFLREYEARDDRMEVYLEVVKHLATQLEEFELTRVPKGENI